MLGGYDPSQYVAERLWATARDGTKVPLSIVYKKGFPARRQPPALALLPTALTATACRPSFSSDASACSIAAWCLPSRTFAAATRWARSWHDDGKLMKKKNTFYDFIDAPSILIDEKWTSPDRLVIEGASAGGLLMGAVVNMRPDLFRAVHAGVPFVDVINTMMDASLPLTVGEYLEWGNPNEKAAYDYMKSYSPYDNL